MKTEFLRGLGLEQDAIDKIIAENGKDVAAEKAKTTKAEGERDNYKGQLDTVNAQLKEFDGVDVNDLKGQITKLQGDLKTKDDEYAAKEADRLFTDSLTTSIKDAGGRNAKAIMALLDIDALKASKDQTEDIKKALESAKKSDAYLFGANEPFSNPVGPTGGGDEGLGKDSMASIRAAMGLPEQSK